MEVIYEKQKKGYFYCIGDSVILVAGVFQSSYDIKVVSALNKPVVKKANGKGEEAESFLEGIFRNL